MQRILIHRPFIGLQQQHPEAGGAFALKIKRKKWSQLCANMSVASTEYASIIHIFLLAKVK